MAKKKTQYACQQCGAVYPRYQGQCYHCGEWNSLVEESGEKAVSISLASPVGDSEPLSLSGISFVDYSRISTHIGELDRVLGGGIVPGSLILLGGSPGIGKSTLLLQTCHHVALKSGQKILYASGEESPQQIKMRAERLGVQGDKIIILSEVNIKRITSIAEKEKPLLLIIDSIQTMMDDEILSAPGSVAQVRECTAKLQRFCKSRNLPVIVVGHITKSGAIAGPRVLEHIVDTVLYFEGEGSRDFRILRSLKNRFGSTQEIGVFAMESHGLVCIENPSEFFLSERTRGIPGSLVVPVLEGSRTVLIEIQALVTQSGFGNPARRAEGFSSNRLSVLLAVMEKRARMIMGASDVFINVVGGMEINEPACDLGVVLAVASSLRDQPVAFNTAVVGEVGLGGEIRGVSRIEERVREASKMGFQQFALPSSNMSKTLEKVVNQNQEYNHSKKTNKNQETPDTAGKPVKINSNAMKLIPLDHISSAFSRLIE